VSRTVPFSSRRVPAPLFQGGLPLRPCLMQTVGHSSPVLSYLLTTHYSLLTGEIWGQERVKKLARADGGECVDGAYERRPSCSSSIGFH
jgi:hypothetical protein